MKHIWQPLRVAGASVLLVLAALCVLFACLPGNNGASVGILLVLAAAAAVPGVLLLHRFLRGLRRQPPCTRAEAEASKARLAALEAQNREEWAAQHRADRAKKRAVRQEKRFLRAAERADARKARELERNTVSLPLLHGLPLPKRTVCTIAFAEDLVRIYANGAQFSLPAERVLDVHVQKEQRQHTQYVSSAGGAIAGAKIGGAFGAMLGGRIQPKTIFSVRYLLVLTYQKGAGVSYLAFSIPKGHRRIRRLARHFCPEGRPASFSL